VDLYDLVDLASEGGSYTCLCVRIAVKIVLLLPHCCRVAAADALLLPQWTCTTWLTLRLRAAPTPSSVCIAV
jgi:hypothetical protein